ncbi:MAG: hypothetical protein BroJett011_13410 [Chloroflexota bacterium]|nr:MAG: hypothetical protein BroJett011_13410 [Chloroflexota bacterium]
MKRVVIIACILGTFLLNSVVLAQTPAARVITVEGKLVNANSGQPAEAGLPLMLHSYDGQQVADLVESVTGPGGTFRFENVAVTEAHSFEVMVVVGQTIYFSPKTIAPAADQTRLELPITIYDTTTDTSALRIAQVHTVIDFLKPGQLQLLEVYIVSNEGDRTVEGAVTLDDGQTASLRFTLPEGANGVSFESDSIDEKFTSTADGFAAWMGVPPGRGTRQVTVRYTLPYRDGMRLERTFAYPVDRLSVIVPQNGVSLSSHALTMEKSRTLPDGRLMDIFSADGLAAGQSLAFELRGQPSVNLPPRAMPAVSTPPVADWPFLPTALVGLGLVLVGGGLVWLRRRQTTGPTPILTSPSALGFEAAEPEKALILAIARLDEAYHAGLIPENRYHLERAELWTQLKALPVSQ